MSVALRTEILPTDLTAMMRWPSGRWAEFRLHQMQTTQYVLTFDRYLHPDKEKNLFIA